MKTDIAGTSSTAAGEESFEIYTHRGKVRVQYDYRTADGELFSIVQASLKMCRRKRDEWLAQRKGAK